MLKIKVIRKNNKILRYDKRQNHLLLPNMFYNIILRGGRSVCRAICCLIARGGFNKEWGMRMPASKLRQLLLFMPIPASVRLAERYGLSRSRRLMHPLRARLYNLAAVEIFAESGTGSLAWIRCIFIHSLRRYHWLACLK